jgi:hypothetical protein
VARFVLHDARRDLEDRRVFVTWVAGISHYPAEVELPDFAPGSEVVLRSEPDNPFDPNDLDFAAGVPSVRDAPPARSVDHER